VVLRNSLTHEVGHGAIQGCWVPARVAVDGLVNGALRLLRMAVLLASRTVRRSGVVMGMRTTLRYSPSSSGGRERATKLLFQVPAPMRIDKCGSWLRNAIEIAWGARSSSKGVFSGSYCSAMRE